MITVTLKWKLYRNFITSSNYQVARHNALPGNCITYLHHYAMKKLFCIVLSAVFNIAAMAQNQAVLKPGAAAATVPQPFLFSVNTLTAATTGWAMNYSGSYGERTSGPFGYDGVDQQFAVKGYLGNRFTLYANAALGFSHNGAVNTSQQAEVIHDFIGGQKVFGPRFGLGFGVNRDFTNVAAIFSRVTAYFEAASWRIGGNLRFEKAFSSSRDDIDLITSLGFHHRVAGSLYAGIEAIGEDLEGFWDKEEAEGGAKLLLGPSVSMAPANSRFSFSISGGPVFYATHSQAMASEAIRDIGTIGTQNGYTVRAMVTFSLPR